MYQRNIIFRDAEWKKANIKIEITTRNGYPELTMSWDYSGWCWQIVDHIKPKNEYQEELINIWNTQHLKEVNWLMQTILDELCDNIESEESNNIITIDMLEEQFFVDKAEQLDCEVEKLMAWCLQEWVTVEWLDNIEVHWDTYTIEWNDWLIYTDEEADEACKDYIKETAWAFNQDFIISHSKVLDYDKWSYNILKAIQEQCESWNDAILRLIDDIDEFCDDAISSDWRWHFLSWYDWNENEVDINWTTYYLYKQ